MNRKELAERLINRIAEKLNEMKYSGMDYNTALVNMKNDLVQSFNMPDDVAAAFRDLGLEAYCNKYKNGERVFKDEELQKMLDIVLPESQQKRTSDSPPQASGW
jgi:hypothetical protein